MDKGRKEYGHGLIQKSGYDWVKEALEEALDLSIYLSAKLIEVRNEEAKIRATSTSELSSSI
jgi:3-hydroxyacyl-CoA dehydrogenase